MTHKILILGGAGFIGSSLSIGLKKNYPSWKVICLDNLRRRGSELNLPRLRSMGIQFIHGDIRSESDLDPKVLKVDTIIDCSAEPSVLAGFSSPQYVLQTNLVGTINILELARKTDSRLLFLSTSRVYPIPTLKSIKLQELPTRFSIPPNQNIPGISPKGISEECSLVGYRSLYGSTKLSSELLIEEYRQAYGIQAIINRCGVITGPWQMGKVDQGVFALWVAAHHFGKTLNYIGYGGTGKQVRDLLHIDDLLRLIDIQLQQFGELDGGVFNVGGGMRNTLSLVETTRICEMITGKSIPINPVMQERQGDIPAFITNCTKVTQRTLWEPKISSEEALQDIYQWISQHNVMLEPFLS